MTDCHNTFRIETERLILREWRSGDFDSFAVMNADPEVMRFCKSRLNLLLLPQLKPRQQIACRHFPSDGMQWNGI